MRYQNGQIEINLRLLGPHQGPKVGCRGLVGLEEASGTLSPRCFRAAWAAASRAMGTRKGEQLT
eukprot:CAMPEP_0181402824 /NCGR_PEP_ID=MMETSP1110-20121109/3377_1 /TAXON_ID=174948 /ORGANISM="Symbiodinium sp., Strain CCMP421" /LENGTH=63 /DNA_ID=CAMNT_0023525061 /DNA_START=368 /DNA_END=559 /DNA_ORIENTATION=+